jgi:histidine ammonia-lyase
VVLEYGSLGCSGDLAPLSSVALALVGEGQVHGAVRDTVDHARRVADRELASSIDNPVVTRDGRVESNGNFHGAPLGYVLDFPAIAVADLKSLAVPVSVDSVPTSGMKEDHVSLGWHAGLKLRRAMDGLACVLAIELLTACRAGELRRPLRPAPGHAAVIDALRSAGIEGPGPDRRLSDDIATATQLVIDDVLAAAAETFAGPLGPGSPEAGPAPQKLTRLPRS